MFKMWFVKQMKKIILYFKALNRQRNHKTHELKRRLKLYKLSKNIPDKRGKPFDSSSVKRILFPFLDLGIGDAVCHTGMWRELKKAGYIVQIAAEERNRALFEKIVDIDEIFIIDINELNSISQIETDLIINPYAWMKRKELFSVQLLQKTQYKYAMSFGGWLNKPYNLQLPAEGDFHITDQQKKMLTALNIHTKHLSYSLPALPSHEETINEYLLPFKGKKWIVINPFASVDERSLSREQLVSLISKISEPKDNHIFIVGERKKTEKLNIQDPAVSVSIFPSLWDTVALIKQADLVISVDTAIVHIACALDKKLVAIYYSMLLDHNKNYEGNKIFGPIGENAKQLIFNKYDRKIDINLIATEAKNILDGKCVIEEKDKYL